VVIIASRICRAAGRQFQDNRRHAKPVSIGDTGTGDGVKHPVCAGLGLHVDAAHARGEDGEERAAGLIRAGRSAGIDDDGRQVEARVPSADGLAALGGLGRVGAQHDQDRGRASVEAACGGQVYRPAVALGVAVTQLRLDDHRQGGLAGGGIGDEHGHVGEVLHRHDRAHVGRGESDLRPAR
jgi:hypothetical protein